MAREIYAGKLQALRAGDEDAKLRVGEGKDIMSVLCPSMLLHCFGRCRY